ncbi:MAG: hypothetical protein HS114_09370 [Anaerolineales bacterium]|nr:hypothetical protein [Anaerolineales bacterium]
MNLLHLRARWYNGETGTFLSRDSVESEPPYQYVRGNPVNRIDPSGYSPSCSGRSCGPDVTDWLREEIALHNAYGKEVGARYNQIWLLMINPFRIGFLDTYPPALKELNLDSSYHPFDKIINSLYLTHLSRPQIEKNKVDNC